jgi:hypothetical protein
MSKETKTTRLKLEVASLNGDGYHLFAIARIKRFKLRMLIDTGASRSVVDKIFLQTHFKKLELATAEDKATGLGSNTIISKVATLPELKLGRLHIKDYAVAVLDLSHVNETYQRVDLPPIAGVIGSDVFYTYNGVINYSKKVLALKWHLV